MGGWVVLSESGDIELLLQLIWGRMGKNANGQETPLQPRRSQSPPDRPRTCQLHRSRITSESQISTATQTKQTKGGEMKKLGMYHKHLLQTGSPENQPVGVHSQSAEEELVSSCDKGSQLQTYLKGLNGRAGEPGLQNWQLNISPPRISEKKW